MASKTDLFDHSEIFERVKNSAVSSLKEFFPIVGKTKQLILKNIHIQDDKDTGDFADQEKVKLSGGTWGVPIYADMDLIDKQTGRVVDSAQKMKLMTLPKLTDHRFSYIVNGNEYQVINQLRLKPGIYHRVKANEEIEAQVNSGRGLNYKIPFNRDTGVFHLKVGTANIKMYPILRDLGVSDDDILKHWGPDILRANQQASAGVAQTESQKLYQNLFHHEKAIDKEHAVEGVRDYLNTMTEFDPDMMHYHLDTRDTRLTPEVLLKSTRKLLRISQGDEEQDDRDSVVAKKLMSVDDFIHEKLHLTKTKSPLLNKLAYNVDKKERIREIIKHEDMNKPIESFFTGSQLSNAEQQINPLHMLSMIHKLTFHGEGGIQSEQAVTAEARGVHPTHLGFIDPVQTPESHNVGAVLHTASALTKQGNELLTRAVNLRTSKEEDIGPRLMFDSKVAFPDEFDEKQKARRGKVRVMYKGQFDEVDPKDVDFVLSNPTGLFSWSTKMIPFLASTSGNRALTTSKMQEQALPLVHREAPLVQIKHSDERSLENALGQIYSFRSPTDGVVSEVGPGFVKIRSGGEIHTVKTYDNFPLNNKHFFHSDVNVKVGDAVKKDQVIADTNYTKNGHLALGTNLRIAYMPWHGYNYEDGVVVSESAAKKLSSMHMHKESVNLDSTTKIDKELFRAHYPTNINEEHYRKLDDEGVVKVGQVVNPGDLLITALKKAEPTIEDQVIKNIHKSLIHPWRDHSVKWEHDTPGEIVKIGKHGKRLDIYIKTIEPAVVGDKIAGRHGNKGILTTIIPDREMPHDKDGNHVEMILNPQGVPTRMNLGTILETTVSKTAKKTGKPYIVENFAPVNHTETVRNELKKHGFDPSGTEELIDPNDGKSLGKITSGNQYIMKLDHSVSKKFNVRTTGGYTSEGIPSRGSDEGGQSSDPLFLYSMLAHGAKENLFDMTAIKAERNDEFWRALQAGRPLPPPKPTFVFEKFVSMLKALGANVEKNGDKLILHPVTDGHTLSISTGALKNARGLLAKNLMEEEGGLFDPLLTGGIGGSKWSHIDLAEPLPSPLYEDAIKTILGINETVYEGLLQGTHSVGKDGKIEQGVPEGNLTGSEAFKKLLTSVKVPEMIDELRAKAIGAPEQKLNKLHKQIRYLEALKDRGLNPDVYLVSKLPVLPPKFRPIFPMPNGNLNSSDLNFIYKDIFVNNEKFGEAKGVLPEEDVAKIRFGLYQWIKGLTGLADPPSYRKYKGILTMIRGTSQAKEGLFQGKLVSRRQDLTARSTAVVDPHYAPDEVGLPEEMAKGLYKPFVIRRLVGMGFSPLKAEEELERGSVIAQNALHQEMEHRPIMLNRAPSLHKFSVLALKPKIVQGHAIKAPPLITAGLSLDFDGDCVLTLTKIVLKGVDISNRLWYNYPQTKDGIMPFIEKTTLAVTGSLLINIENFPRKEETKIVSETMIEYDVPAGIYIPSFNGEKNELLPVTKFSIHPVCEEVLIKTHHGREFIASSDHSLYTLNPETLITERSKPAESIGRLSPVSLGFSSSAKLSKIQFIKEEEEISEKIQKRELPLNEDIGWLIGVHIGDGWSTTRDGAYQLHLAAADRNNAVIKKWSSIIESLSTYKLGINENPHDFEGKPCYSVRGTYSFNELACWLKEQVGHGAANKHLPAWVLETPEEFRRGLFVGLLDTDGTANWSAGNEKKKPQFLMNYCTISRDLAEGVCVLARTLGLSPSMTTMENRGKPVYYIVFSTPFVKANLHWIKPVSPHKMAALERLGSYELNSSTVDILPKPERIRKQLCALMSSNTTCAKKNDAAIPEHKSIYLALFAKKPYMARRTALQVKKLIPNAAWESLPAVWRHWVEDTSVGWDLITEAKITGNKTTMYDLTVPGTYNFALADGLIVQDTVAIHIPVTEAARNEAWKMLPTNNLENPGTGKLMMAPAQEAIIGLYLMTGQGKETSKSYKTLPEAMKDVKAGKLHTTDIAKIDGKKTSVGRYLVNEILPKQYRNYETQFDKKSIVKLLSQIRMTHASDFGTIVNSMKDIGNLHSTKAGYTLTLDDIATPSKDRDAILDVADKEANKIRSSDLSADVKRLKIIEAYNSATDRIDEYLKKLPVGKNGLLQSVASGARGDWVQARQVLMAPMLLMGTGGEVIPTPARRSYSEGLSTADYFIQSFGARSGAVDRSKQTSVPGYAAKRLINSTIDQTVTAIEDPDDPGVPMSINNQDIRDRFLSEDIPGVAKKGDLVTDTVLESVKRRGLKDINIMSPLTCTLTHGIAAKSFGLTPGGKLPDLGENVGVISAQSLSEVLTQAGMRTFHQGGSAKSGAANLASGVERMLQLFEMPDIVKGAGTLAEIDGKVDNVEEAPQGGAYVSINGVRHYVPSTRTVTVKKGDPVEKGTLISDGVIRPQTLLHLRGVRAVQDYLVDEVMKTYQNMGFSMRRQIVEAVVRPLTNLSRVLDPANVEDYSPGDYANTQALLGHQRNGAKIHFMPVLKGINTFPSFSNEDFISQLNSRDLKRVIQQGASRGWSSDIHGTNPIVGWVWGAEFGRSRLPGRY